MPDGAVKAFPPFVLKRDHFFVFPLLDNFRGHLRATERDVASIDMHQRFKRCGFTRLDLEKIDIHCIAFRDAVLPPASFDNCVSHKIGDSGEEKRRKIPQNRAFDKQINQGAAVSRPPFIYLIGGLEAAAP